VEKPQRLWNKNFTLLWQGQLVSQLGNQAHTIAMMYWLKQATGSASVMGLILMLSMLPGVLLSPFGGTIADRVSRKKIIVGCDLLRGLVVISLAVIMFSAPDMVDLAVAWLAVTAVLIGILSSMFGPAISASIPDLVPTDKLASANSLNQSSSQASQLVGQGIGGILFRVLGAPLLFLIDGLTYIFSGISEMFITIPQTMPEKEKGAKKIARQFMRDTAEGFTYIWRHKGMRNLFFTATFLNFFLSPLLVLLPFYIDDHLQASADWYGYFLAAIGAGAMIGFALAGMIKLQGKMRTAVVSIALFLFSANYGLLGFVHNQYVAVAMAGLFGILSALINVNILTILQLTTPSNIRGRVFGVLSTITGGLMPIGLGLTGVIADWTDQNIPAILGVCGALTIFCTILVMFSGEYRKFLAYIPPVKTEEDKGNDAESEA